MKNETKNLARHYFDRANQIKEDVIADIREIIARHRYEKVELVPHFQDMDGNIIVSVDEDYAYGLDDYEYPLEEVGLLDAISILETLQEQLF